MRIEERNPGIVERERNPDIEKFGERNPGIENFGERNPGTCGHGERNRGMARGLTSSAQEG